MKCFPEHIIATPARPAFPMVYSREASGRHDVQSEALAILGASNLQGGDPFSP